MTNVRALLTGALALVALPGAALSQDVRYPLPAPHAMAVALVRHGTHDGRAEPFEKPAMGGPFGGAFISGEFGVVSRSVLWALGPGAIYRSDDAGQRWTDITPPKFSGRLAASASLGTSNLWFGTSSASGEVITVYHSGDGGRTWSSGALRGCRRLTCTWLSLSFVSPGRGWALLSTYSDTRGELFATSSGGKTWKPISATAFGDAIGFVLLPRRICALRENVGVGDEL